MSRVTGVIIFLAVATGVIAAIHYYLWLRFVRDPQLPPPWRVVVTVALIALAAMLVLTPILYRLRDGLLPPALLWSIYVWMGTMFIAAVVLGAADLMRIGTGVFMRLAAAAAGPADLERRLLLARFFGGAAALGTVGLGAVALRAGLGAPKVRKVVVRLARLPAALSGLRIVQITDLHVGPTIKRPFVEQVVRQTNALTPDVIVITGDLVDGTVEQLAHDVAPLAELSARHGVYFVTGNHEYYSGVEPWLAHLPTLGVRVLRNERVTIGEGEASIYLAGVDDWTAHQFGDGHGADLERALEGRDLEREVVLLAHQPKQIFAAAERKVGLVLSGHTHGGQIWPFGLLVRLAQPYVAGLARHGETQIYVSRGTGFWGPPMRLAAPSELTEIELRRARS